VVPAAPAAASVARFALSGGYTLAIPAGSLKAGFVYRFEASVSQDTIGGGTVAGVATPVDVSVEPLGIRAVITNNRRRIETSTPIRISALQSSDLDLSRRPLGYQWTCKSLDAIAATDGISSAFERATQGCINHGTGAMLDVSSVNVLPEIGLPDALRGDLRSPAGRGPVLSLPSGAIPPGKVYVFEFVMTRNPGASESLTQYPLSSV